MFFAIRTGKYDVQINMLCVLNLSHGLGTPHEKRTVAKVNSDRHMHLWALNGDCNDTREEDIIL